MRRQLALLIAAALVVIVAHEMADPAGAKVVRNGAATSSNPAVEAGGHRLPPQPYPPTLYSLIGAIAMQSNWLTQCPAWPWSLFGSLPFQRRQWAGRTPWRAVEHRPPQWVPQWVPPPMP